MQGHKKKSVKTMNSLYLYSLYLYPRKQRLEYRNHFVCLSVCPSVCNRVQSIFEILTYDLKVGLDVNPRSYGQVPGH